MNDRTDDSTKPTKTEIERTRSMPRLREGDVVKHARFRYRAVIAVVDDGGRRSTPWYHILVHGSGHTAFVPETLLEVDTDPKPIEHPNVHVYFDEFKNGRYTRTRVMN